MTLINVKKTQTKSYCCTSTKFKSTADEGGGGRARARQKRKRSRQAKANKPKNHQSVTSDTSSVSDDEAHKTKLAKLRNPDLPSLDN